MRNRLKRNGSLTPFPALSFAPKPPRQKRTHWEPSTSSRALAQTKETPQRSDLPIPRAWIQEHQHRANSRSLKTAFSLCVNSSYSLHSTHLTTKRTRTAPSPQDLEKELPSTARVSQTKKTKDAELCQKHPSRQETRAEPRKCGNIGSLRKKSDVVALLSP